MTFDALPPNPSFPGSALGRKVELLINGTWTDVSTYLDTGELIVIGRGHPDESVTVAASTLAMKLRNTTGTFTSRNPTSSLYPYLVRNTQCRVSIPEGAAYMRSETDQLSYASCPGTGGVSITGDMDVQCDLTPDNGWMQGMRLVSKWASTATGRSWSFAVNNGGTLAFAWTTGGTLATYQQAYSTLPVTVPAGRRMCVRVTFAASTGTVTFYTAAAGLASPSWAQLGAPVVLGSSSLYASSTVVEAGAALLDSDFTVWPGYQGKYHALIIKSGISGTTEASPDFTAQPAGTTSFSDAQGNTWTLGGTAEISNRDYRGHFEIPEWPQNQDPSGRTVTVAAAGGGLLRRLGQVNTPLQSAMRRYYTTLAGSAGVLAYWPMEDMAGAQQLASGTGGPAMTISGSPQLASNSGFACSAPLPVLNGATLAGSIPPALSLSFGAGSARFLIQVPSGGDTNGAAVAAIPVTGTTLASVVVVYQTTSGGQLYMNGYGTSGGLLFTSSAIASGVNGELLAAQVDLSDSGGSLNWSLSVLAPGGNGSSTGGTLASASVNFIPQVIFNPYGLLAGTAIGHAAIFGQNEPLSALNIYVLASNALTGPLNAWSGEPAGARFGRLCSEQGIQFRGRGNLLATTPMGNQTLQTLVQLLQQCADADRGIWTELRQALGWGYVTRQSLYNQPPAVTVDYDIDHLAVWAADSTEDDQTTLNDLTLTNADGSSTRQFAAPGQPVTGGRLSSQAPPAGIGTYDNAPTPSVAIAFDKDLDSLATWMLHVGTVDEPRYPGIVMDLENRALASLFNSIVAADLGDRMVIDDPPPWLPPDAISQLWQGVQESIGDFEFQIAVNGIPESPYEVAAANIAHAGTAGSQLNASAASGVTLLAVETTAGNLWTTAQGDFPFDVMIAGERCTVTNIDGPPVNFLAGNDASFDTGTGNWVTGANDSIAQVSSPVHSGSGALAVTSVAAGTMSFSSCAAGSITSLGLPCSPGDTIAVGGWFMAATAGRTCQPGADFYTGSGAHVSLLAVSGAADTTAGWTKITGTVTAPALAAYCRLESQVLSTGAGGEVHYMDDAYIANVTDGAAGVQSFTADRSINGVVKAQASGAAVQVYPSPVAAL